MSGDVVIVSLGIYSACDGCRAVLETPPSRPLSESLREHDYYAVFTSYGCERHQHGDVLFCGPCRKERNLPNQVGWCPCGPCKEASRDKAVSV